MGWQFRDEAQHDLTRSLDGFEIPAALRRRLAAEHIALAPATREDIPDVLEFERSAFPGWYDEFKYVAEIGDQGDILVARDAEGAVIGTLLIYSRQSSPRRLDPFWRTLLGEDCGGLNAVGVAERARGRGIGLALVAWGSDILKARGVGTTLIGWTTLVDFYGKLGYTPWQSYAMSWRTL
jgi:predicted N-acetyltransferase YhbS